MLHLDNDTIALMNDGKLSRYELEELYALKALMANPGMAKNVMIFEKLCLALSGSIPDMEAVERPEFYEAAIAVQKLLKNGIIEKVEDLGEQVLKYLAILAVEDGWPVMPDWLSGVRPYLSDLLPDHCESAFATANWAWLSKTNPWDDENPVSCCCAKVQAFNHLLNER